MTTEEKYGGLVIEEDSVIKETKRFKYSRRGVTEDATTDTRYEAD